jgi:hypothetical protein
MNRYYRNRYKRQANRLTERFIKESSLSEDHIDVRTFSALAYEMLSTLDPKKFENAADSLQSLVQRYNNVQAGETPDEAADRPSD